MATCSRRIESITHYLSRSPRTTIGNTVMDPQLLSKALSNEEVALIDTLGIVLKALGYQLSIKPIEREKFNLETDADELGGETVRVAELQ